MKSIQMLRVIVGVVALVGGFHFPTSSAFAQAGSDNVAAPTPITGTGLFPFDLVSATTSNEGNMTSCLPWSATFTYPYADNDVWWCWTATCDGSVTLSTCGLTTADTVIAIYPGQFGCQGPGNLPPLCCNNSFCGQQSELTCVVTCGQTYLIQVGTPYMAVSGIGQLSVQCTGTACAPAEPFNCNCCGGRPPIVDSLTTPFAPGAVAVATKENWVGTHPAVYLFELGGQPSAPAGIPWNPGRFSHSTWTMANLGCVFGVTLDETGNIFVGQSSVYGHSTGFDRLGYAGRR